MVTASWYKAAALKFLKRIMKKYGQPRSVVTDGLCYFRGDERDRQRRPSRSWPSPKQSRGEFAPAISTTRTSHATLSEREDPTKVQCNSRAGLQSFNQERHLVTRDVYKQRRSAALVEWRGLATDWLTACHAIRRPRVVTMTKPMRVSTPFPRHNDRRRREHELIRARLSGLARREWFVFCQTRPTGRVTSFVSILPEPLPP